MEAKINAAAHSVHQELKCQLNFKNYIDSGLCLYEEAGQAGQPELRPPGLASAVHSSSQQTDGEAQREAALGTPHARIGIHTLVIT